MTRSLLVKVLCLGLTMGICGGLFLGSIATHDAVQQIALSE